MKPKCSQLQDKLSIGDQKLNDNEKEHLDSCPMCRLFVTSADSFDEFISQTPETQPDDELVARTLAAVQDTPLSARPKTNGRRFMRSHKAGIVAMFAVAATLLLAIFLRPSQVTLSTPDTELLRDLENAQPAKLNFEKTGRIEAGSETNELPMESDLVEGERLDHDVRRRRDNSDKKDKPAPSLENGSFFDRNSGLVSADEDALRTLGKSKQEGAAESTTSDRPEVALEAKLEKGTRQKAKPQKSDRSDRPVDQLEQQQALNELRSIAEDTASRQLVITRRTRPSYPDSAARLSISGTVVLEAIFAKDGTIRDIRVIQSIGEARFGFEEAAIKCLKSWEFTPAHVNGKPIDRKMTIPIDFTLSNVHEAEESTDDKKLPQLPGPVQSFMDDYQSIDDIVTYPNDGFWANTYIPGDPAFRALAAQLTEQIASLPAFMLPMLDPSIFPARKPFDAPSDRAMSLSVSANKTFAQGPQRTLLQIGLQGAAFGQGHKPKLHTAMIWDLPPNLETHERANFEALLAAMLKSKGSEDQCALFIAGRKTAIDVPPQSFRYGTLEIAKRKAFSTDPIGNPVSLATQIKQAARSFGVDQNELTLCRSILIVSTRPFDELATIELIAQECARVGIQVSVISAGNKVPVEHLDRVALAGRGFRRLINDPHEAESLINRQIHAVSQVIARGLSLRIKLAEGVKLVQILGSYPLNQVQTEHVKAVEKDIDRQMAVELGIPEDRHLDEDGILIHLPLFMAGDQHIILLDLVTSEAGAVADVGLRYKDLIWSRNTIDRDHFSLSATPKSTTPSEFQVHKNLYTWHLSSTLRQAHKSVCNQDYATALELISTFKQQTETFMYTTKGFKYDQEMPHYLSTLTALETIISTAHTLSQPNLTHVLAYSSMAINQRPIPLSF